MFLLDDNFFIFFNAVYVTYSTVHIFTYIIFGLSTVKTWVSVGDSNQSIINFRKFLLPNKQIEKYFIVLCLNVWLCNTKKMFSASNKLKKMFQVNRFLNLYLKMYCLTHKNNFCISLVLEIKRSLSKIIVLVSQFVSLIDIGLT